MFSRQSLLASISLLALLLLIFLILFTINPNSPLNNNNNNNNNNKTPKHDVTISYNNKTTPKHDVTIPHNNVNMSHAKFSILIGIFTRPEKYDRRHFLRLVYGTQPAVNIARIDVRFVLCRLAPGAEDQRLLVGLEIIRFGDVIILNCTENMNSGKTYTYFSSLPGILTSRYDYVMKADDDVYFRLGALAKSLEKLPRSDMYYGFVIPCPSMNPFVSYMSGMGFAVSWDLVEWIGQSSIPANNTYGPEDKMVGRWLDLGKKAKNRFNNKPAMYDYPGTNGRCSHDLIPDTIAVHRLKRLDQWIKVLSFFNVTRELQRSRLYHF